MNLFRSLLVLTCTFFGVFLRAQAAPVHGSVRGPDNKPIAGATIILLTPDAKTPVKLQTSDDGTWSAELPKAAPATPPNPAEAAYADLVGALAIAPGQGFGAKIGKKGDSLDILLPAPTSIGGQIQDEKGVPLAGVELRLKGFYTTAFNPPGEQGNNKESQIPFDLARGTAQESFAPTIATKSDEQGKWHFEGIPQGMRVFLAVADNRYSVPFFDVKAGTLDSLVIAKVGATIRGRVLLPDGKPIAGIQVFYNEQQIKTEEDGHFTLPSVAAGEAWVIIRDDKQEWISISKNLHALRAGETRDMGDIKLSHGVLVKGQVVDETGKGIAGATIRGGNGGDVQSGPDGRFQRQVAPGTLWLIASKTGFLSTSGNGDQTEIQLDITEDETEHTGIVLKLQCGVYVGGTVRDQAGQPATGVQFNVGPQWENPAVAVVEKDGSFRLGPLWPGKEVTLHASDAWDLTQTVKIKAPAVGQEKATPPLNLTVKKIELASATGRIVSTEGVPFTGVNVHLRIYTNEKHDSWSNEELTTDANGSFSYNHLRPEQAPAFDSLPSEKYVLVKAAPVTQEGTHWNLGDIVVSALDAQLTGQIVDSAGTTVAGAHIALAGHYPVEIVTTDTEGRFTLNHLPHGEVTLLAAKGQLFARQTVQSGPNVRIVLQDRPAPTPSDGEKLLRNQEGGYPGLATADNVPPLDPDFALSILQQNGTGAPAPAAVALLIAGVARRDPATASVWGLQQWEKLPQDKRSIESGTLLARAILPLKRDFATRWLAEARAKMAPNDFSADAANNYLSLAGLAGALDNPDAGMLLDLGLTATDQSVKGEQRLRLADNWGRAAGTTLELANRLVEDMEPQEQLRALAGAIQTLAPINREAAQTLLTHIQELRKNPAVRTADEKQEAERSTGGNWQATSGEVVGQAQRAIALALTSAPGPAALEMTKQIGDQYNREDALLQVARCHLVAGHKDDAAAALRAFAEETHWDANASTGAGIALTFDPPLAQEMFDREYQRLLTPESNTYHPTAISYAFYHAPLDAGQSRLILENEWDWLHSAPSKDQEEINDWKLRPVVLAMGILDLPRALEMLDQLKDRYDSNESSKLQIGLCLMTKGQLDPFVPERDEDF